MSKELEEAVYILNEYKKGTWIKQDDLFNSIDKVVQQAERVQKLEEIKSDAIKQIDVTQRRNERLEERVQELEEIIEVDGSAFNSDERIITEGFHTGCEVDYVTIQKSDYERLIEQAERVQELEKDIKEWEIVNEFWEEINTQIVEQNKRLLERLALLVDEELARKEG